jgi:O-antigen/teichoic acid export membrane protein
MLGQSLLRVVISRQLGATELGLYYLAASLAFLPTDIAAQIVGEVAFPFYARLQNDILKATEAFKVILTSLAFLLLPMSALLISLAPSMVNNVLDERWIGTVLVIQVLTLANIIDMFGGTISPILKGIGHPDKVLVMETVQTLSLILIVWEFTKSFGVVGAALAWLPSVSLSQFVGYFYLRKILHNPFSNLGKPFTAIVFVSLLGAAVAYETSSVIPGLLWFHPALSSVILMGGVFLTLKDVSTWIH